MNLFDEGLDPPVVIGNTCSDEAGHLYVTTLDNSGNHVWTPLDGIDGRMAALLIAVLRSCRIAANPRSYYIPPPVDPNAVPKIQNAYNRHIGRVLTTISKTDPLMPRKHRMQLAVASWREIVRTTNTKAQRVEASEQYIAKMSNHTGVHINSEGTECDL